MLSAMPRRTADTLLPLELSILTHGIALPEFHGFEMAKTVQDDTGARRLTAHGTLYKALGRMERAGLLSSRWEDPAPTGRPRRRLYQVTGAGERALAAASRRSRTVQPQPGLAT
jgi:DNA-binding PadR family transcriptional regulator